MNGDVTVSDGTNDFDIASHDGTNGLKLGGTLVTSTAVELNYLDINTLGTSEASKAVTAGADGVVKLALSSSDTNADRVGLTVSHETSGTPAAGLGAGISFEIEDAGGVEEQGRVSTVMDTVTNGSEDSKIVFMVQAGGTLTNKAEVKKNSFNIPTSSSYAINGVNVLSATGLGSAVVSSSLTSVGTLSGLTVNGDVTVSDGTNDFDIASHDGTNGLKLGGTLVTSTAVEMNYLDISTLGTSEASKAVTAASNGVVTLSSTLVVKGDSTTVGGNNAFELQRPTHGSGHGTALSIIGQKAGGTDGNGGDIELKGGEGSANGNGAGGDVILRTGAKTGSGSDGNIKIQKSDGADLLTITNAGVMTLADGTHDFNIASHDGTNGLKLGGTLVTAEASELNYLDIQTLGTSANSKAVTAASNGVVTLSSTLVVKGDSTTVGGNGAFELQRPTHGSGHGTALSIIGQKAGGTDGNGGDIELKGGEGSANGNGAGGDVILRHRC